MTGPEILQTAQVLRDKSGNPKAVQLSLEAWRSLLEWVEDLEDRAVVKDAIDGLKRSLAQGGALHWDRVAGEWEEKDSR
jgi:tetrahydromethanopterin S-methyltransferase subunit H